MIRKAHRPVCRKPRNELVANLLLNMDEMWHAEGFKFKGPEARGFKGPLTSHAEWPQPHQVAAGIAP